LLSEIYQIVYNGGKLNEEKNLIGVFI